MSKLSGTFTPLNYGKNDIKPIENAVAYIESTSNMTPFGFYESVINVYGEEEKTELLFTFNVYTTENDELTVLGQAKTDYLGGMKIE